MLSLAAAIAREAVATGRTIGELVIEKGIFSAAEPDVILDPHELTEPGVAGGLRLVVSSTPSSRSVRRGNDHRYPREGCP